MRVNRWYFLSRSVAQDAILRHGLCHLLGEYRLLVIGVVLALLLTPGLSQARGQPAPQEAVVQIIAADERRGGELVPKWSGSGVIISPDGLILTNCADP